MTTGEGTGVCPPLLMLDLFAGFKGASRAMAARGWGVVTVDILESLGATVTADLRSWSWHGERPDLVWASPPCQEFSRLSMPWTRRRNPPPPDLSLVEAARRIIAECRPRWWVIENVRGAVPFLGPGYRRFGPFFLWGDFPPLSVRVTKVKERLGGWQKLRRAAVPLALSRALAVACEAEPTWVPCACCAELFCLRHERHAFECDCPPVEEWGRSPYGAVLRQEQGAP